MSQSNIIEYKDYLAGLILDTEDKTRSAISITHDQLDVLKYVD